MANKVIKNSILECYEDHRKASWAVIFCLEFCYNSKLVMMSVHTCRNANFGKMLGSLLYKAYQLSEDSYSQKPSPGRSKKSLLNTTCWNMSGILTWLGAGLLLELPKTWAFVFSDLLAARTLRDVGTAAAPMLFNWAWSFAFRSAHWFSTIWQSLSSSLWWSWSPIGSGSPGTFGGGYQKESHGQQTLYETGLLIKKGSGMWGFKDLIK